MSQLYLRLSIIIRYFFKLVLVLLGLVVLYLLFAFIFSIISVKGKIDLDENNYTIYLLSNGVHMDIVLPYVNDIKDWNEAVTPLHTLSKRTDFEYVAFGWGDKGFYMQTPTWADLTFSTALKAGTGIGGSALHVTFYRQMKMDDYCIPVKLSANQYSKLCKYIYNYFQKDKNDNAIKIETDAVYGNNDVFYESIGRYNIFFTCNTWVNKALKTSGLPSSLWTPFDKGIFRHYRKE